MKIVHIEDFFHPDAGYQLNVLYKYFQKFGHEQTIITAQMDKVPEYLTAFFGKENIPQKDAELEKDGVKIRRLPLKAFISGRAVFTRDWYRVVKEEKPDVLFVHGNDTLSGIRAFVNLGKLKKLNCAVVTDSHMLEMASQNRFNKYFRRWYRHAITPIIVKNRIPVIRTQDDPYVEKCLGIPLEQAPWISYGTDTLLFHRDPAVRARFRAEHGIGEDETVFLYTGKLDEAKGGKLLAEAFREKFSGDKKVTLVLVGKTTVGAYGEEIEEILSKSENRIIHFPTQSYRNLPKFYQMADVSVFARQCSLSFYDAQGCGLPVISEDNNINLDRNSHGNGLCFASGNVEDFRRKIQAILDLPQEEFKAMSDAAYRFIAENYNYEDKARDYEKVLQAALQQKAE